MRVSAKEPERRDLALVVADEPCAAAGTFTKNIFCSAPVIISREHLSDGGTGAPELWHRARRGW